MKFRAFEKSDYHPIAVMALTYGSVIIFPAYGPIMGRYATESESLFLSTFFLLSIAAGLLWLPRLGWNQHSRLTDLADLFSLVLLVLFPATTLPVRLLTVLLVGAASARIVFIWSVAYLARDIQQPYPRFFVSILFLAYAGLYVFNVLGPDLHQGTAIFAPATGFILAMVLSRNLAGKKPAYMDGRPNMPFRYLLPIFLIYISAGITYSGIYPLIARFSVWDRFYNVLPFLAALPAVYWVHRLFGLKALLLSGISLLGFSFLFHTFELTLPTYLAIQTLLQSGWAFMNAFVWIFASNLSRINRNPYHFSSVIAAFLLGTFTGSALFLLLSTFTESPNLTFAGLVPLLGVLVFVQFIPSDLKADMAAYESSDLEVLTRREKEIFLLLLENRKGKEITEMLNISPNTLKKHCGSIYRKLDVENKTDLIRVFGHMKRA